MPFLPMNLTNLEQLDDGRVAAAFIREIKRVADDMMDRPGDANKRTVALEFTLTPVVDDAGSCDGARGEFQIKSKVPNRKSKTYGFDVRKNGVLAFSVESPTDPDQTTLDDMGSDGKVRRNRGE